MPELGLCIFKLHHYQIDFRTPISSHAILPGAENDRRRDRDSRRKVHNAATRKRPLASQRSSHNRGSSAFLRRQETSSYPALPGDVIGTLSTKKTEGDSDAAMAEIHRNSPMGASNIWSGSVHRFRLGNPPVLAILHAQEREG